MLIEKLKNNNLFKGEFRLKTLFAILSFITIIIVFVFFDMRPRQTQFNHGATVASVNNQLIPARVVGERYDMMRQNSVERTQGGREESEAERNQMKRMALEQVIDSELVWQLAQKEKIQVTDAEVRDLITKYKAFQDDGRFKYERYNRFLEATGRTAEEFENVIRKDLASQKVYSFFESALDEPAMLAQKEKAIRKIKLNAEFVALSSTANSNMAQAAGFISDADIKAFANAASGTPQLKRIEDYYKAHQKTEFSQPEQAHARHILIKAERGNKASEEAAQKKLESVQKRLAKKENFAAIASEVSEDPGSKTKGGDLGYFKKGQMVPEFEKAAFTQKLNEVGLPVQSSFGFHLIQVLDRTEARQQNLDEVKEKIARQLLIEDRVQALIDQARELVKKQDIAGLEKWLAEKKLRWEETGPFGIDTDYVPKMGSNREFVDLMTRLKADHPLADQLIRQGETTYIVRYKAPPAEMPLPPGLSSNPKAPNNNLLAGLMGGGDSENTPEWMKEYLRRNKMNQIYSKWLKGLLTSADVEVYDPRWGSPVKGNSTAPAGPPPSEPFSSEEEDGSDSF